MKFYQAQSRCSAVKSRFYELIPADMTEVDISEAKTSRVDIIETDIIEANTGGLDKFEKVE